VITLRQPDARFERPFLKSRAMLRGLRHCHHRERLMMEQALDRWILA
jgi:hypothetical protein